MTHATKRPPLQMIDSEADAISTLAIANEARLPQVAALLLREVERARLHRAGVISTDVVTMGSAVTFVDDSSGTERTVTLVWPQDADIAAGRISILTPVGAGLIGLKAGQAILWPDRDGHERALTIVRVVQPTSVAA
jgi:regulator of nucleoside diphosphate kinase